MRNRPEFATEAALCAAFSEEMVRQGWTPYPETSDWDILLVGHGLQVGVEAKLRPSIGVLAQFAGRVNSEWRSRGPAHASILVPYATGEFTVVAKALGAKVLFPIEEEEWRTGERHLTWANLLQSLEQATPLHFEEPAWLPDIIPDVAAGASSPVRLTAWKLRALRLVARLDLRGWVTVRDFREIGLDASRWYGHWLLRGSGSPPRWTRRPGTALVDTQHPHAFATILERERKSLMVEEISEPPPPTVPLPLLDQLMEETACPPE